MMASLYFSAGHKLPDIWNVLFSRLLSLLDNVGNLLSLECANWFFKVWQDGNDLGMVHGIIECKRGSQNIVHINTIEMCGDRCVGIHAFACGHLKTDRCDHVTALLDGDVNGKGVADRTIHQ